MERKLKLKRKLLFKGLQAVIWICSLVILVILIFYIIQGYKNIIINPKDKLDMAIKDFTLNPKKSLEEAIQEIEGIENLEMDEEIGLYEITIDGQKFVVISSEPKENNEEIVEVLGEEQGN